MLMTPTEKYCDQVIVSVRQLFLMIFNNRAYITTFNSGLNACQYNYELWANAAQKVNQLADFNELRIAFMTRSVLVFIGYSDCLQLFRKFFGFPFM